MHSTEGVLEQTHRDVMLQFLETVIADEALKRVRAKHSESKAFGMFYQNEVRSLTAAGVTYYGAKSTMTIETDADKFLYKLHSLRCNKVVGELCEALIPDQVYLPKIVECETYAFCEFVESTLTSNAADMRHNYEGL